MRTIRLRLPAGLRWRLAAWVAGVLLVSAAAVFAVVYIDTGSQLRGQIDRDIAGDTSQLAQTLRPLAGQTPARVAASARGYVRAQPYTATSTLLFVLVPGQATVSNHPDVFGALFPEEGETASVQASENAAGRKLLVPRIGYSVVRVPDVGRMRIHERAVAVGRMRVIAGAGEPLNTVERAQHGVAAGVHSRRGDHPRARAARLVSGRCPSGGTAAPDGRDRGTGRRRGSDPPDGGVSQANGRAPGPG